VWVNVSSSLILDADGKPLHLVSQIEDVTDRKRAESRLKNLAEHDPLTGLLNRRRFDEELADTISRVRRHGGRAAILLIDLDRFKLVNDTYGHKTGDEVLVAVAAELRARLRGTDIVARLGGDEFAAVLYEADAEAAQAVAGDLAAALRSKQVVSAGAELGVTASIGIVLVDRETIGDDAALIAADRALYSAKNGGRDRIALAGRDGPPGVALP
jgi:diguanylate cyclase (GGDEF)-like protein